MDFTVYALSLCLEENAGHNILVKWPLKSSYAAVERDKMPQGKAENPLAQPLKVHRGRGNTGQEIMQKFSGKLGQINWDLSGCVRWAPHYNIKYNGRNILRVEIITFFPECEEISDRIVCSPKHFSESQTQGIKSSWNWRRTDYVSQQPSKCCATWNPKGSQEGSKRTKCEARTVFWTGSALDVRVTAILPSSP